MLFKLIVKVPEVGNTADTPNPPGLLPFKGNLRVPTDQRKFGPTTSGTDLPVLYRLSYEASTGAGRDNLDSDTPNPPGLLGYWVTGLLIGSIAYYRHLNN